MKIAFIIFDNMTLMDFVGVYEPIYRMNFMEEAPDFEISLCSNKSIIVDYSRLVSILPLRIGESLEAYDVVIVPGGYGTRKLIEDNEFIQWIQTANSSCLKVSACTGALILGKSGFLKGKCATTHRNSQVQLQEYCSKVLDTRNVEDGNVITARGVTSSIDLGLYLCKKFAGKDICNKICEQMDYTGYKNVRVWACESKH